MKQTINDFSSFDAKQSDYFCLIRPKGSPISPDGIDQVYVFGHTTFSARALALLFFENSKGYQLDYDQVNCTIVEDDKIGRDEIILFNSETKCGIQIYKTTKNVTIDDVRQKKNIIKWKPLHRKRVIDI